MIKKHEDFDFEFKYFNCDGRESSFCGNGSRNAVLIAKKLGFFSGAECKFVASDGPHEAIVDEEKGWVEVKMKRVLQVECSGGGNYFLDTGSPHYVQLVPDISEKDTLNEGRRIAHSEKFGPSGTNVNFVQQVEKGIKVETFERGVENLVLSCGTGVTVSLSISSHFSLVLTF